MHYSNQQKKPRYFGKLAGLILTNALFTAFGGGGGSSEIAHDNHANPFPI